MDSPSDIKPGNVIKGPQWPEPVEIKVIEFFDTDIHILGSTTITNTHIDQIIPLEEFQQISVLQSDKLLSEKPSKVFLALETKRYRFASIYDPLLAMNTSKVDPLPHQIEAVYGYVLRLPRIRFLIADDPGAGKTIMAGLIIKELKLRNIVKRILIVCPGHLKDQWRRELRDRFEEKFVPVDRSILDSFYGENIWQREDQIITSIDFAKREDVLPSISSVHFDLIIVDEAHKMSAYRYGDKLQRTERYRLGEALSRAGDHLLFLTATPHKGDPENFRLFLDLLEPGFFATNDMLQESIASKDNPLFIRRIKEDLRDFEGRPLFDKKRNVAFALVILQRRLASSTYALMRSLERRKKRLTDLLEGLHERQKDRIAEFDIEAFEDLSEEDRWKEEEIWETLSVAENREDLEKEIELLEKLISQAQRIIQGEKELKLKELKKALRELTKKYSEPSDKKILIFTESRDTMEYLEKKARDWGYTTTVIHGGMKLEDRIKAESIFKNETDLLIATEAAGEGINLQFCHLMINYDIPWNPNRLEQRMGRIHRYGQQKEVYIVNLVAEDTREGRVFTRLFEKLKEIRKALGSDKVFDVLGEVLYGKSLSMLLMEAAANARSIDEILKELDIKVDEEYIAKVKENLGESLATRYIDYTRIKEMAAQAREHRLIPEYTESYFRKAFLKAGGKLREKQQPFLAVDSVPYSIRKIADEENFKKAYGQLLKKYPKITFDKELAFKNPDSEFVCFGHPLFEATMAWVELNYASSLINGARFTDPDGRLDGEILFYEGEIKDGTGSVAGKRLFAFYVGKDGVKSVSPSIIWDLAEGDDGKNKNLDLEGLKKKVSSLAISQLKKYREELLGDRIRQAQVKEKYGIRSLEHFIVKLDGELIDLKARKDQGEQVDLPIRNKEERKQRYEKALQDLKEKSLTMSMPRFVGIISVSPLAKQDDAMYSDEEVERIGMEIAIKYEIEHGRRPEDVSEQNLGFDIRSRETQEKIRYIEVKARAGTGPVALTQNEWFKARRFGDDYYLYAVMNAKTQPELYIIANPAKNLDPTERIEVVRYVVGFDQLSNKASRIS